MLQLVLVLHSHPIPTPVATSIHIIHLSGFTHYDARDTIGPTWVVIHDDESPSVQTTLNTLRHRRLSYHYYITRKGTIFNLVDPSLSAKHAGFTLYKGNVAWNDFSLGICLENNGHEPYTKIQYIRLNELLQILKKRYPTLTNKTIVGHSQVAWPRGRKHDPGEFFVWRNIHPLTNQIH